MTEVSIAEFKKSDLRVAKILEVEEIPGADRLWKLQLDLGSEKKQIVAGIKAFYTRESLLGKSIAIVNNLTPTLIRGVESSGMLLAAKDSTRLSVLTVDPDIPAGSVIG